MSVRFWGEEGLFPQVSSKRLEKAGIVYSTPDSWPAGRPLIQNYPGTVLAGRRSVRRLGLVSKVRLICRGARTSLCIQRQVANVRTAHELCAQYSVPAIPQN